MKKPKMQTVWSIKHMNGKVSETTNENIATTAMDQLGHSVEAIHCGKRPVTTKPRSSKKAGKKGAKK